MMSQEAPGLFGISHVSEDGISHLSDSVILLQFLHRDGQLKRALTLLKTRASRHDPDIREFKITPEGIVLDEPPPAPRAHELRPRARRISSSRSRNSASASSGS
jgi:KaiC/GvpD/RAD55 family RecA-like ATPase